MRRRRSITTDGFDARRSAHVGIRALFVAVLAPCLSCADIPMAPRAEVTVTGRILDRDGGGIASLSIRFLSGDPLQGEGTYWSRTAATNADGTFSIALPQARYGVVLSDNYGTFGYPLVFIPTFMVRGGAPDFEYRYEGIRIEGTVTGPAGTPVNSATVRLYPAGQAAGPVAGAACDVGGHYSLLVPAGKYDLRAAADNSTGTVATPRITVPTGTVDADTTIDVALTGAKVDLTVRLNGTVPLAGAYTIAIGPRATASARTDSTGVITLYLPVGDYAVEFLAADAGVISPDPYYFGVSSDESVPIDVPTIHWSGIVRFAGSGEPASNVQVAVREVSPTTGDSRYASTSTSTAPGSAGAFDVYVRPGRPYDILVTVPGTYFTQYPARSVSTAADSTFDLFVDAPAP